MGRKSILQFIHSLRLNKSDEAVLIRHIEDSHVEASGPDIHDRCTDKVR